MMRKTLLIVIAIFALAVPAQARQRIWGYCMRGGASVQVGGLPATSQTYMLSGPNCSVRFFISGSLVPAVLYADNSSTPKSNPVTGDAHGYFFAYVDNGRYDLAFSNVSGTTNFTIADVISFDPATFTGRLINTTAPLTGGGSLATDLTLACPTCVTNAGGTSGSINLNSQNANFFFAGPVSGAASAPVFRGIVTADLPAGVATTDSTVSAFRLFGRLSGSGAPSYLTEASIFGSACTTALTFDGTSTFGCNTFNGLSTATPTANRYPKGNGTAWVTSSGSASGVGTCPTGPPRQFVSGTNSDAAPDCNPIAVADLPAASGGKVLANLMGSTSDPTISSATPAVLPEMTATVTVAAGTSILLLFTCEVRETNVSDSTAFRFYRGATGIGSTAYMSSPISGQNMTVSLAWVDVAPSAGSTVYAVKWNNSAGGNTSTADSTNRTLQVIQLQ
jgi:hypothetical protein